MYEDKADRGEAVRLHALATAYRLVRSVLRDEHGACLRLDSARGAASALLADEGADGLTDVAVELALKLASALERIAAERGLAAADLAEVWFDN